MISRTPPWGDHLASPHQGLLPHPSPLNSVAPSMARRPLNLDCHQLSLFNDFEIPRAIISSHQGSVQSLCIAEQSCYLSKHTMPCTVDAWLKSPEFTELQLLDFYYPLEITYQIPNTMYLCPQHRCPSRGFPPLSTPPPLRCATYQTIWY